jgi:hypothetical protein
LQDLLIRNIPHGASGIYLNGDPVANVYVHDTIVRHVRFYCDRYGITYSNGSPTRTKSNGTPVVAHSCLRVGPLVADTTISHIVGDAGFSTSYFIYADANAQTVSVSDGHIFSALESDVYLSGNNNDWAFTNIKFDLCGNEPSTPAAATPKFAPNVVVKDSSRTRFTGCMFQHIERSSVGLLLDNAYNTSGYNNSFTPYGTLSPVGECCIKEQNIIGDGLNQFVGGYVQNPAQFGTLFKLNSPRSFAKGVAGHSFLGMTFDFTGSTESGINGGLTRYLGPSGTVANSTDALWNCPADGQLLYATILTSVAPAATTNYTVNVYKNDILIGSGTVAAGSFSTTIYFNASSSILVNLGNYLTIEFINNSTAGVSGATGVRYSIVGVC